MADYEPNDEPEYDMKPKNGGLAWYQVWLRVLTNPSITSFLIILDDPRVTVWRALRWLFLSAGLSLLGLFVFMLIITHSLFPEVLLPILHLVLIYAALKLAYVVLLAIGVHVVARLVSGTHGLFTHMIYALAAFMSPLEFIEIALLLVTQHPLFFTAIGIYRLILTGLAVRTVYRLNPLQTIGAVIGGMLLRGVLVSLLLMLLAQILTGLNMSFAPLASLFRPF